MVRSVFPAQKHVGLSELTPQTHSLPSLTIHPDLILPPVDQNQCELTLPKRRNFYLATVSSVTEWENAGVKSAHVKGV